MVSVMLQQGHKTPTHMAKILVRSPVLSSKLRTACFMFAMLAPFASQDGHEEVQPYCLDSCHFPSRAALNPKPFLYLTAHIVRDSKRLGAGSC